MGRQIRNQLKRMFGEVNLKFSRNRNWSAESILRGIGGRRISSGNRIGTIRFTILLGENPHNLVITWVRQTLATAKAE